MIDFPKSTAVHRRMPKEAFYKHLPLTKVLKDKFVSDVDRIVVENSLTKENLNLTADSEIKEILFLSIKLKKQEFDAKIIEAIARQNPHKLVFYLCFEGSRQLAIYHGRLYRSPWMDEDEMTLKAEGFSLDEIWEHLIERIALYDERASVAAELSIDDRLALQEQIVKLEKQIKKTEDAAWKEQQPKKRFEIYSRLQSYKQKLEELKNGQA
ncbi:MAG: DUF4391 domain-containing protein [Clostridium sp.]|nr:DUF4391 domain-containing protein [Acetatifactor muris]MCM1527436.1 DUF4391 domain-containing protein [Bacteroides sp.]MCM1562442.1 DUF4391 domain-containing protein [Clostridium sp.]